MTDPVVKVLVPVSGGKDSQACLKLAVAAYGAASVRGLFCDTQFEHPTTYNHVLKLEDLYGVTIDRVTTGSVEGASLKHGRFPGGGARHCTEELKIWPTKWYCKALAEQQGGFEVWYGMRTAESPKRKKKYAGKICDELYPPHEIMPGKYPKYLAQMGVMFRLAVLDWSKLDVLSFLDGQENPLYEHFDRVGCFPCLAAGDAYKKQAFDFDDFGREQHRRVIRIGAVIGKSVWETQNYKDAHCGICST